MMSMPMNMPGMMGRGPPGSQQGNMGPYQMGNAPGGGGPGGGMGLPQQQCCPTGPGGPNHPTGMVPCGPASGGPIPCSSAGPMNPGGPMCSNKGPTGMDGPMGQMGPSGGMTGLPAGSPMGMGNGGRPGGGPMMQPGNMNMPPGELPYNSNSSRPLLTLIIVFQESKSRMKI